MLTKKIAFKLLFKKILPVISPTKKGLQTQLELQQQQITTLQKTLQEERIKRLEACNKLAEFTAMMPGALCGCNLDLNINFASLNTFDFLEISSDTLNNNPNIADFISAKDFNKLKLVQKLFNTGFSMEVFEAEIEIVTAQQKRVPTRVYVSGIYEAGELTGFKFFLSDISAFKEQQRQIENSQKTIESILREMPIGGMFLEKTGVFSLMNSEVTKITGYSPFEINNVANWTEKIFNKKDLAFNEQMAFFEQRKNKYKFRDKKIITRTGETKHVRFSSSEIIPGRHFITITDLSDIYTLVNNAFDPICLINEEGRIVFFNQATLNTLGRPQEEIIDKHFMGFIPKEHRRDIVRFYHQQNTEKISHTYKELPLLNIKKEIVWYGQNAVRIERNGKVHFLIICRDIAEKKELEKTTRELEKAVFQLQEANRRDAMTGLINRPTFVLHLEQTIKNSLRNKSGFVLGYIDVNDLTTINNNFGHEAGDELIIKTAGILAALIRNNDIISRFHGDEFVFILTDGELFSEKKIRHILDTLSENVILEKAAIPVSSAIGLVRCTYNELESAQQFCKKNINKTAEFLIHKADTQMRFAKETAQKIKEQERLSVKPNAFLIENIFSKTTELRLFIRDQYILLQKEDVQENFSINSEEK